MKSIHRFLAMGALAALLSTVSMPASAVCCVFDSFSIVGAITALQSAAMNIITSKTQMLSNNTVKAISGETNILSNEEARGAGMVSETVATVETGIEAARQEDRFNEADACAVMAPSIGPSEAMRSAAGYAGVVGRGGFGGGGRNVTGGAGSRLSPDMRDVLDIAAGRKVAPSSEVVAAMAASGACNGFASVYTPNAARSTACTDAKFAPNSSNGTPDADVRAETLFIGPQTAADPRLFKRKLTVEPGTFEQVALEAYMRNLSTPVDLRQLKRSELQTDGGRQYLAFRDAYEARMNLAERPARTLAANRMASPELIPMIQQLLIGEISGPLVKDYLAKNFPNWAAKGISVDEMFNMEVERRYLNPQWHLVMASKPPETHVREQTEMMAFQSLQLQRIYELLEMQAAVNGQTAASQVRQEMLPQLIKLHSSVASK